jgi:hypothetical protein
MTLPTPPTLTWTKATKSSGLEACVELASAGDVIYLRDSKHPEVHLTYTVAEIDAFIDGAKRGEFDFLIAGR